MNLPICEITVGVPDLKGMACTLVDRADSPKNITPRVEPITTRVSLAFFHSGGLKAVTPLEMASTPVTAAQPEAKALRTMTRDAPYRSPPPPWPTGTAPR